MSLTFVSLSVQFILSLWTLDLDLKDFWHNLLPKEISKRKLTIRSKETKKDERKYPVLETRRVIRNSILDLQT